MNRKKRHQAKQKAKRKAEKKERVARDVWAERAAAETDTPRSGLDEGCITPPIGLGNIVQEFEGR